MDRRNMVTDKVGPRIKVRYVVLGAPDSWFQVSLGGGKMMSEIHECVYYIYMYRIYITVKI